jgi:hypothetical protein
MKTVIPTTVVASVSMASLLDSASVGTSHASLTASEGVRDLSDLVKMVSMIYAGTYSNVYLGKCGGQLVGILYQRPVIYDH